MRNPLLDQEFLRKLDLTKDKKSYAKIILLTFDENPVYEIQGKITGGSVNIDGASAVRRTCSLTMVAQNVDVNNIYWGLKNKFKLEVGVENNIDPTYPDIIWFKQGLYVITGLNMSVQSNNFSISINGKDKGCLINGEVGGTLNASTDFGKLEEFRNIYYEKTLTKETYKKSTYYYKENDEYILDENESISEDKTYYTMEIIRDIIDIPIPDIIKNAVHVYAGELLSNIVLNDIDNYGLELLEYRGDTPMYMPRQTDSGEVSNLIVNGNHTGFKDAEGKPVALKDIKVYYDRTGTNDNATIVYDERNNKYNIIKINYGETAGYRRTELTYPGELVANVGEALTAILDKIKNMFSDFEYFYDIDGRFIFQKKKTYINTSFNNLTTQDNETYAEDAMYTSSVVYSFEEGILLSAFTDAPQILNIRNDFSIWGKRKGVGGAEIPVHLRYAIDFKPECYFPIRFDENGNQDLNVVPFVSFEYNDYQEIGKIEKFEDGVQYFEKDINGRYYRSYKYDQNTVYYIATKYNGNRYDWRELIYQMALDYFKYNHTKDNFTQLVAAANQEYYPMGITGYETYYTDMQGFWRQLYNPEAIGNEKGYKEVGIISEEKFKRGKYYILKNDKYEKAEAYNAETPYFTDWVELDIIKGISTGFFSATNGLNENVSKYPETLNFWFDFMSVDGDMGKYAISTIGNRPKAINDDKVSAIYFQETPSVLFLTEKDYKELSANRDDYNDMTGYTFIQLTPSMENYFTIRYLYWKIMGIKIIISKGI